MSTENEGIILAPSGALEILAPVMDLAVARQRLRQFQEFVKDYLVEDEDFGKIPGTNKPTLLKPGADKLCELYGLADSYSILSKVEDFDKGLFDYTVECSLTLKRYGVLVSQGLGSCNSFEGKYRWRDQTRKCPECSKESIIKGREEYGGGWVCFKKKGGCGAKWADGAKEIESQDTGKVLNDDIATLKNTILKMAKKRSKIDATLSATRSSGIFTQDIEDFPHGDTLGAPEPPPSPREEKKAQKAVEEKNGLIKLIGTVTQKNKGNGFSMCHVRTEAGDNVLLRCDQGQADKIQVNGPIRCDAKRLPTDSDIRMYQLLGIDEDLTGILQASVIAAKQPDPATRSFTEEIEAQQPQPMSRATGHSSIAGKVVSDKQVKRLWAIATSHGVDKATVTEMCGQFGCESPTELTYKPYNEICTMLEQYVGRKEQ